MASNTEEIVWNENNQVKWVGIRPGYHGEQLTAYDGVVNGTVTIYTVPAGKILLLFTDEFSGQRGAAGNSNCDMLLYDATPAIVHRISRLHFRAEEGLVTSKSRFVPLICLAGYSIRIFSDSASTSVAGEIEGILIDE